MVIWKVTFAVVLTVLFAFLGSPAVVTAQSTKQLQDREFQSRILGGDETDEFEAVGIVGSTRRGGFCTGTLISPFHVLTAAHCAAEIENATEGTFEILGRIYTTRDVIIHPDFDAVNFDNDLAILVLSEEVDVVKPSPLFRSIPQVGDVLFIVGFGGTGSPVNGSDGSFGIKREGMTMIDEVQPTLIIWKFDDPTEANTAAGDSGGPGYIDDGTELAIASITSGGTEPDSALGDCAFNTRVDVYVDWIDRIVSTTPQQDTDDPPTMDDPIDDGADPMSDYAEFLNGPFPFLQLLIYWLTALYENLTGEDINNDGQVGTVDHDDEADDSATPPTTDEGDGSTPPATDEPAVIPPSGDTPVIDDPAAGDAQASSGESGGSPATRNRRPNRVRRGTPLKRGTHVRSKIRR